MKFERIKEIIKNKIKIIINISIFLRNLKKIVRVNKIMILNSLKNKKLESLKNQLNKEIIQIIQKMIKIQKNNKIL